MESYIRLYNRDGAPMSDLLSLTPIVRTSLETILNRNLTGSTIWLQVYAVPMNPLLPGDPIIRNLSAEYGYARVSVMENGKVMYQHPHTIEELVSKTLQVLLKRTYPQEKHWGFYLIMPGIAPPPRAVMPLDQVNMPNIRHAPDVQGNVIIKPYGENERPAFGLRRIPDEPLPEKSLDDYKILKQGGDHQAFVKVLLHEHLFNEFDRIRPFSDEVEEGGFLVGRVYEDRDTQGTYLLELTNGLNAEHTGASLLHFTYTGDSFSTFKQTLRKEHPEERLLGWYHTHLFPATDSMGLSSIDLQLHFTTFRMPWQLAGLINIDGRSHRTIRFYVRQSNIMVPCPQWVVERIIE